jgi:hypothetical protein
LKAFSSTSLAFSWVSVSRKRTLTPTGSSWTPSSAMPAAFSTSSTLAWVRASVLIVALALETCTAGDSPKKFGRV